MLFHVINLALHRTSKYDRECAIRARNRHKVPLPREIATHFFKATRAMTRKCSLLEPYLTLRTRIDTSEQKFNQMPYYQHNVLLFLTGNEVSSLITHFCFSTGCCLLHLREYDTLVKEPDQLHSERDRSHLAHSSTS